MKLLVVAAPIFALAAYVGWRAVRRRPLSRRALGVVVSLYLLAYLGATVALGLFWVARMELPRFDWHYLFGYAVAVLASVHVVLQLGTLEAFFGRHLPRPLVTPDRRGVRRGVLGAVLGGLLVVALIPAVWLALLPREPAGWVDPASMSSRNGSGVRTGHSGRSIDAVRYLHEASSYTAHGLLAKARVRLRGAPPPFKDYPDVRSVGLPEAAAEAGVGLDSALLDARHDRAPVPLVPDRESGSATLTELATLLFHGYGVTAQAGTLRLRAAASAGALYPTDLYVAVRQVAGLPRGIYYFDARGPALFAIGGVQAAEELETAIAGGPERSAPLTILLAASFQRTASKYRERAYRYVAMDAGHVAANLELAAAGLGWRCVPDSSFDDAKTLAAVGGVADREGALLLLACGPKESIGFKASRPTPEHALPELPEHPDREELTGLSHRMTSWRLVGPGGPSAKVFRAQQEQKAGPASSALASERVAADVFSTIQSRRSRRAFTSTPLSKSDLMGVVRATMNFTPLRRARLVEAFVLVRNVMGVEPGAHRTLRDGAALETIHRGDVSQAVHRAGLSQDLLGKAAAILVLVARDDIVGRIDGARDYRTALLEAGLAGERAYLSATARGLGVCGVGAFIDADLRALVHGDRLGVTPLYLVALGPR